MQGRQAEGFARGVRIEPGAPGLVLLELFEDLLLELLAVLDGLLLGLGLVFAALLFLLGQLLDVDLSSRCVGSYAK